MELAEKSLEDLGARGFDSTGDVAVCLDCILDEDNCPPRAEWRPVHNYYGPLTGSGSMCPTYAGPITLKSFLSYVAPPKDTFKVCIFFRWEMSLTCYRISTGHSGTAALDRSALRHIARRLACET